MDSCKHYSKFSKGTSVNLSHGQLVKYNGGLDVKLGIKVRGRLVIGLMFSGYESVCITSAIIVTLPKFASVIFRDVLKSR